LLPPPYHDGRPCHLHDLLTIDYPAVQFISARTQPASLRFALSSARRRDRDLWWAISLE